MDLLLDEDTHDIIFINGQSPVTQGAAQIVAQRLKIRLQTFLGEWFINTTYGIPYWQRILGKKTSKVAVDRIFQEQIRAERGVVAITQFNSTLSRDRQYTMNFRVRAANNEETDLITITAGI